MNASSICSDNSEDVDHEYTGNGGEFITLPIYKHQYFPKTKVERPDWLVQLEAQHEDLAGLIEEIYVAFDNEIYICAAIAARTVFEMVTVKLDINRERFVEKLDELKTQNHINADERERLDCLVEAGHASAHRGWKPNRNDMRTLFSIMDSFVHRTIILPEEARQLRTRIPARPRSA